MDELIEFLRSRVEEDEADAKRGYLHGWDDPTYPGWDRATVAGVPPLLVGRLLREVEAKRRIMDEAYFVWSSGGDDVLGAGWNILCRLAAVYADHPDYQSEWQPES